jgi:hypothetical protein
MIGADVEVLRSLSIKIDRMSSEMRSAELRINYLLQGVEWAGPDLDAFRQEWKARIAPEVRRGNDLLSVMALTLKQNADDQERTSSDGPLPSPATVPDPVSTEALGDYPAQPEGEVTLDDDSLTSDQVYQGQVGDCWFLASLTAVAASNPEFIRQHMRRNPDGTWTVTMFRDGQPVEVTVSASVPPNSAGGPGGEPNWVSIYEKAAASYFGGHYQDIDGDWPDVAFRAITGGDAVRTGELDLAQIQEHLANGPVAVASEREQTWWPFDDEVDDSRIVPNHAYSVDRVEQHDGQMMIHVVNPWGPDGGNLDGVDKVGDLWLTEEQYKQNFSSVSYVDAPKVSE